MSTFADMNLPQSLAQRLTQAGLMAPTPVQQAAIPLALKGLDIMAQAKTGSGKTLAFLLPIIEQVMRQEASAPGPYTKYGPSHASGPKFLVLAPTRELALQIEMELRKYAPMSVTSLSVYGGTPIERHYRALRRPPMVVVGTPGRLLDLAGSGHLKLGGVTFLVMDEADQMLDRGFLRDIQRIVRLLPAERQTLLFSATFSGDIQTLAQSMQRDPARISVDPGISTPTTIVHAYYVVPGDQARTQLVHTLLQTVTGGERSMVFCDQKYKVRRLAARLGGEPASVGALTGNHSQAQRERTLGAFRAGRLRSLVATDVAARGLDIQDVAHVIHYELPTNPNSYVHRTGRTGRAEKEGATFLILSQSEEREYLRMVRQLRIETKKLALPVFVPLPSPAPMPVSEQQAPRHRPRRSAEPSGRRFHDGENRGRAHRPGVAVGGLRRSRY
ncbi:MAG: DEAD/DEAH box helicase [Nitrospiraceae bacterium]|nr:DEAD/DEAH box helicase [Nitrospiraceae bacterium]